MLEKWREIADATRGSGRWRWAGMVFSLLIVGGAAVVLSHILRRLNVTEVLTAFESVGAHQVALAAMFATGSYLSLTLYDLFALRTIGRTEIPYRTAAIAGFASYSIGHNLGATALTCSIVRYYVYSTNGLGVVDVARICFITGLTFWLGNICVLGIGIAVAPEAASLLNQLPPALNRGAALALLAACLCYLLWVSWKPRAIGLNKWQVTLPGGRSTLVQIAMGIFDLTCCASAMYVLMPDAPSISFVTLTIVFVSALLLGYASHAPGGIGVFEAAMLVSLPQFVTEDLIARILLFRLICYIAPGILAVVMLGIRQIWLTSRYSTAQ
jgi:glycosyltransferase 2 family protein